MSNDMRTPLGRIRGLGAARTGTKDFLHQRMSAAALVPLAIWFVCAALSLVGASQAEAAAFLGQPAHAVPMLLFLGAALYHMSIGLQIVIEDYVHGEAAKLFLLLSMRVAVIAIGLSAGLALGRLALTGH